MVTPSCSLAHSITVDADRFAGAHDRCAGSIDTSVSGRGTAFIISFSAVGKEERIADAVLLEQVVGLLGVEAAAVAEDRDAEDTSSAAARPSGRRSMPSRPATRTCRPSAERNRASARSPARCRCMHAVRLQRALRRAGRAAGVDDQRGIVGRGIDRMELRGCPGEQLVPREHAGFRRATDVETCRRRRRSPTRCTGWLAASRLAAACSRPKARRHGARARGPRRSRLPRSQVARHSEHGSGRR